MLESSEFPQSPGRVLQASAHSLDLRTSLDQPGAVLAESRLYKTSQSRMVAHNSVTMSQAGALVLS